MSTFKIHRVLEDGSLQEIGSTTDQEVGSTESTTTFQADGLGEDEKHLIRDLFKEFHKHTQRGPFEGPTDADFMSRLAQLGMPEEEIPQFIMTLLSMKTHDYWYSVRLVSGGDLMFYSERDLYPIPDGKTLKH